MKNVSIYISQVGFLKKSLFKESSCILLVFSPTYLFTLFQGRWIQKSMLAIRKMSFNVTKWLPKKQHLRTNHIRHFINGPCESRNVGIKLYFRYQLFIFVYITWYDPRRGGGGGGGDGGKYLLYHQSRIITRSSAFPHDSDPKPC
jgi:hypothetical protein